MNNIAQEFARNYKQKEIERIEKLPTIDRAIKLLEKKYSKKLLKLDVFRYTQLLDILQSKQSSFQSSLSKAEVFLLMKDGAKVRDIFIDELFQEANVE